VFFPPVVEEEGFYFTTLRVSDGAGRVFSFLCGGWVSLSVQELGFVLGPVLIVELLLASEFFASSFVPFPMRSF